MRIGNFLVVPLAEDGKIAIGSRAVGVRVRYLGTEHSVSLTDPTRPYLDLLDEAKAKVQAAVDADPRCSDGKASVREGV